MRSIAMAVIVAVLVGCDQLAARMGVQPLAGPSPSPSVPVVVVTVSPSATTDVSSYATVTGNVEDDHGERLDGVTLTAKVASKAFANGQREISAKSQLGTYVLNGCPTGVTLTLTGTKAGYKTQTQTYVALANLEGDPRLNQVHFTGPFALLAQ